jgi:hypothetical protein
MCSSCCRVERQVGSRKRGEGVHAYKQRLVDLELLEREHYICTESIQVCTPRSRVPPPGCFGQAGLAGLTRVVELLVPLCHCRGVLLG